MRNKIVHVQYEYQLLTLLYFIMTMEVFEFKSFFINGGWTSSF